MGFFLLAGKLTDLSLSAQWPYMMLAGGGIGLMLGTASTDAVNRAPSTSYSEVTGITQTSRNFGASLGLAVLGAILIAQNNIHVVNALTKAGVPSGRPQSRLLARYHEPRARGARETNRRSSTTYSSPLPTPPRPSSTSWPGCWRSRS